MESITTARIHCTAPSGPNGVARGQRGYRPRKTRGRVDRSGAGIRWPGKDRQHARTHALPAPRMDGGQAAAQVPQPGIGMTR